MILVRRCERNYPNGGRILMDGVPVAGKFAVTAGADTRSTSFYSCVSIAVEKRLRWMKYRSNDFYRPF